MMTARVLLIIATVVALAAPALATDRTYMDSFAVSPNGQYRIDAKSPDNQVGRPFAERFVYTLTDTTTRKIVWERKQPMKRSKGEAYGHAAEGSPRQLFVTDDGLVAAYTESQTLLLLDAAKGRKQWETPLLDAFPPEEREANLRWSTAGCSWEEDSDWFFLELRSSERPICSRYFVVRPHWGHRLIIDVATGIFLDLGEHHSTIKPSELGLAREEVRRVLTATIESEKTRALVTLRTASEIVDHKHELADMEKTRAALHTVAFLKLGEAQPLLSKFEQRLELWGMYRSHLQSKLRATLKAITPVVPEASS